MDENTKNWRRYYEKALSRPHHPRTEFALQHIESKTKTVIDCGCGTGSDIAFLSGHGFVVLGFDINSDSVAICLDRFGSNPNVCITQESFETFKYRNSDMVLANSSLYFAAPDKLNAIVKNITSSISIGGVFSGDFLGYKDSWANGFRVPTSPVTKNELLDFFSNYEVVDFRETDELGKSTIGIEKHWHTYSVVAVRRK